MNSQKKSNHYAFWSIFSIFTVMGCGPAGEVKTPRSPVVEKWYQRALQDFNLANMDASYDSVNKGLSISSTDTELRMLGARLSLAKLDFDEAIRFLQPIRSSEASQMRGRAYWYKGDLEKAAHELDIALNDPEIVDEWAKMVIKLCRTGSGREPFSIRGSNVVNLEMLHISMEAPFLVVQVQIDGQPQLAVIGTGNSELLIDSSSRKEPSWVSLKLGNGIEVQDVPAFSQDLSGISKVVGVPVKAMLGNQLIRKLNATLDYVGHQFIARLYDPPPPPKATQVPVYYLQGGATVIQTELGSSSQSKSVFFMDTTSPANMYLDEQAWMNLNIQTSTLKNVDAQGSTKQGTIPSVRLGSFEFPKVVAFYGATFDSMEKVVKLNLDGSIGLGMISQFRITFGDQGRLIWIEDSAAELALIGGGSSALYSVPTSDSFPTPKTEQSPPRSGNK